MGSRMRVVAAAVAGYVAGTIPSADLATRAASSPTRDLRLEGSGNPGAANAIKVLGAKWGYAVMAADIAKGAAACGVGRRLAGANGAHVAGTAAVVGHCFPVWNGFRGGKGVAASVGQCLATFPAFLPVDLAVAGLTSASPSWKRRAESATAVSSVVWVASGAWWAHKRWPNLWGPPPTAALPLASAVSSAVILYRFRTARTPP